jgi:hypothetical protein
MKLLHEVEWYAESLNSFKYSTFLIIDAFVGVFQTLWSAC